MTYPWFEEVVRVAREQFSYLSLTTTGHFINERNIDVIKLFDFVQLSLYHYDSEVNDSITRGKNNLEKTVSSVELLNKYDISYGVSNIIRRSIIKNYDQYINYLISKSVKEVSFGLLSVLGRGKQLNDDWILSEKEIIEFSDILMCSSEYYKDDIKINTWEENSLDNFFQEPFDTGLLCGAGVLEWTINENGNIKPCSFFPDKYYDGISVEKYEEYSSVNQKQNILSSIIDWEKELKKVGESTKNICEHIYSAVNRVGQNG